MIYKPVDYLVGSSGRRFLLLLTCQCLPILFGPYCCWCVCCLIKELLSRSLSSSDSSLEYEWTLWYEIDLIFQSGPSLHHIKPYSEMLPYLWTKLGQKGPRAWMRWCNNYSFQVLERWICCYHAYKFYKARTTIQSTSLFYISWSWPFYSTCTTASGRGELGKTFLKVLTTWKEYSFLQGSPCTWWWHDLVWSDSIIATYSAVAGGEITALQSHRCYHFFLLRSLHALSKRVYLDQKVYSVQRLCIFCLLVQAEKASFQKAVFVLIHIKNCQW